MNKRHLAVAVVAVLAMSSSTIASAEGGSHRIMGEYDHIGSIPPIALSNAGGLLTIDTSTVVPSFHFDTTTVTPPIDSETSTVTPPIDSETSTVTPQINSETSTATTYFDDEPGISDDGAENVLPAGNSFSQSDDSELTNLAIPPAVPGTPPTAPSWITKPQAKSNDSNQDHSDQSSEDSQD